MSNDGIIVYHDHPGQVFEDHKDLSVEAVGGDYVIAITDFRRGIEIKFRHRISGGFEFDYPKTTRAIAELHRAFAEEIG